MKFSPDRSYSAPEKAARKILEITNAVETVQDGRIHIEKINGPFLFREKGTPAEYGAGLDLAIARSWLWLHESGTKFTQTGADLSRLSKVQSVVGMRCRLSPTADVPSRTSRGSYVPNSEVAGLIRSLRRRGRAGAAAR